MATAAFVAGSTGAVIPGAPRVVETEFDRRFASLPGLLHFIDPGKLASDGSGRESANCARVRQKGGALTAKISSDPAFNNQPVINLTGAGGGLRLPIGWSLESYTFICVASIDATRRAAGTATTLFATSNASALGPYFRMQSQQLIFRSNTADTVQNGIGSAFTPAGNVAAVWAVSFDKDEMTSAVLYGDNQLQTQVAHELVVEPSFDQMAEYGSAGTTTTSGWVGKLGAAAFFDRPLHKATERSVLFEAVELLKGKYGIA